MIETTTLARLSQAKQLLVEAKSLEDVLHVRNVALAAETYFKTADGAAEMALEAEDVRIRAERSAGTYLAQVPREPGAGGHQRSSQGETSLQQTLAVANLDDSTAHRWQVLSVIPEEVVNTYIAQQKNVKGEITAAGLLKAAEEKGVLKQSPDSLAQYKVNFHKAMKAAWKLVNEFDPVEVVEHIVTSEDDLLKFDTFATAVQQWVGQVNSEYSSTHSIRMVE